MDKKYIALIIVVLAIVGAILFSGGGSYTSANISDVVMSENFNEENFEPVGITDTYSPETPNFHLSGQMNNVPSNTKVGVDWHYLEAENTWIDSYILEVEQDRNVHFSLTRPENGWPKGSYEARIFIEGKGNVENVRFTVQENAA